MNANQKALSQKKAYLKKITAAARKASIFEPGKAKTLGTINKALEYGEDNQWLAEAQGINPRQRNSFNVLVRRNAYYRQQVLGWQQWQEQRAEADWQERRGIELNRKRMGLSNTFNTFYAC